MLDRTQLKVEKQADSSTVKDYPKFELAIER